MKRQSPKSTSVAIMLVLFLSGQTRANEPPVSVDTSGWLCDFCNYPQGWFGTLDFGPGYASDASLKFADYRGITEKGAFISIDGDMHYLDRDGRYFDMYTRNLGIDSRQLEMRGGLQGRLELRLAYREIPKYRGYGTQTPFRGTGTDQLALPSEWVKARTTSEMSTLSVSLIPVTLETKRKIFEAGLNIKMSGNWRYDADFQRTEKKGARAFGAGVFTIQSSHFPAPVDFSINLIDMGIEYSDKRSRIRFGFSSSSFSNRYTSLGWENPFTPVGNTAYLRAALEPDSRFYQFNIAGSFRPNARVRLSGHASTGHITQDVNFTPYSSNPDFDDLEPPRTSLNGDMDTRSLGAKMTARLSQKLNLFLSMKYVDRDNRTPTDFYTPVITDLVLRQETPNRPYSFERGQYSAQFTYLTYTSISFNAGAKQKDYKRTLQSVRETKDRTWWSEVSIDHWSAAQLRVRLETSHRDKTPYRQVSDPGLQENILMRKFHLADRDRDRVVFELDVSPGARLSANLSYFVSRDRYGQSILGLIESDEHSVSLDLGYSVKTNLSAHAFVSLEDYDSEISSVDYDSAKRWMANTKDSFVTWGFGVSGQIDGLGNDGINAILTLGPESPSYNITVLRLLANYSF